MINNLILTELIEFLKMSKNIMRCSTPPANATHLKPKEGLESFLKIYRQLVLMLGFRIRTSIRECSIRRNERYQSLLDATKDDSNATQTNSRG